MKRFWIAGCLVMGVASVAVVVVRVGVVEEGLRAIEAKNFPGGGVRIGSASHYRLMGTETIDVLDREFGYITPSNDYKQTAIHPSPGQWKWEAADGWVAHAKKTGQVIRMHSPLSPQASRWALEDDRTPDELRQNMTEYLTALCERYNDEPVVKWMDVVNETVEGNGDWFGPRVGTEKWENPWTILGTDANGTPSYIREGFEIAGRLAPNIKLIVNQHSFEPPALAKVKGLIDYLLGLGLRVDGLGWQAHVDAGWEKIPGNMKMLSETISWTHERGLGFHVTEANVWLRGEKDYAAQAETFAAIVKALLEKRDGGEVTWNLWNIRDSETQDPGRSGSLFFEDYEPKPGYFAIRELLENPPAILKAGDEAQVYSGEVANPFGGMLNGGAVTYSKDAMSFGLRAIKGAAFDGAYEVKAKQTEKPWQAAIRVPIGEEIKAGQAYVLKINARAMGETTKTDIAVVIQGKSAPYTAAGKGVVRVGAKWEEVVVKFTAKEDVAVGKLQVTLQAGAKGQAFMLGRCVLTQE